MFSSEYILASANGIIQLCMVSSLTLYGKLCMVSSVSSYTTVATTARGVIYTSTVLCACQGEKQTKAND